MTCNLQIPWPLEGMRVLVVGAARTGRSAARFLARRGARVTLADRDLEKAFPALRQELEPLGVKLHFGGHSEELFTGSDGIVLSPGVPWNLKGVELARERGVPVVAELELAFWYLDAPIIAITGTNGKTTTTTLVGSAMARWGRNVFVGGNIGNPLIHAVEAAVPPEVAVVEVSSFQLEGVYRFRPRVAALLNITEDHLDRHPTRESYRLAKARIFANQAESDTAVVNLDDPEVRLALPESPSMEVWGYSVAGAPDARGSWAGGAIQLDLPALGERIPIENPYLTGPHGTGNLLAACLCAVAVGCPPHQFAEATRAFKGLEHRMECVGEARGISFVNDSKATNVGAVIPALASCRGPVVLIAGGKDKGIDFRPLRGPLKQRARAAILMGEAADRLELSLRGTVPLYRAEGMEEAVRRAFGLARPGDVVLLSPACSSFDRYADYEQRGSHFKEIVKGIMASIGRN